MGFMEAVFRAASLRYRHTEMVERETSRPLEREIQPRVTYHDTEFVLETEFADLEEGLSEHRRLRLRGSIFDMAHQ